MCGRNGCAGAGDFGEDLDAHVAANDGPLVVLFGQDGADEADDRVAVGEDADDVGAAAEFPVEPLCGLFDQSCRQCSFGNTVNASISGPASSKCAGPRGASRRAGNDPGELLTDRGGVGLIIDRPHHRCDAPLAVLGTRVKGLPMKCVRQRCQLAPGKVAATAATRPECASELTSLTPLSPRATRPQSRRANRRRPRPYDLEPKISRNPSLLTPTATSRADVDRPAALPALYDQGFRRT